MKPVVAIIGTGTIGSGIARNLARAGYRILIADSSPAKTNDLRSSIYAELPGADVEILDCSREASWEADLIIQAMPHSAQSEAAAHIKDVVTGKILVSMADPDDTKCDAEEAAPEADLAHLLPFSKIVTAKIYLNGNNFGPAQHNGSAANCFVEGDDKDAVESVVCLVQDAGFTVFVTGDALR